MHPKYPFKIPIYAECISPTIFAGKSIRDISSLKIWEGNKQKTLADAFSIQGKKADEPEETVIHLSGSLSKIRMIGAKMTTGKIVIEGNVGMRLGEGMKGGEIIVKGDADSWVGCMMEGGAIEVTGSVGDYVGSSYRGSTEGMKGGVVVVHGDVGNEAGCHMRGGLINVGGNIKDFAGIHMSDGTIVVHGDCSGRPGAGMLNGKVIICGYVPSILPTFTIDSIRPNVKANGEKVEGPFYRFIGDIADQGNGKLFVSQPKNPHLKSYEKYLNNNWK
jgi:formylmethanofuran dehydrogenase subunit C